MHMNRFLMCVVFRFWWIQADASEPGKVILRGVTVEAEGTYNCEVSSEGTFHTDRAEANLTVIGIVNSRWLPSM